MGCARADEQFRRLEKKPILHESDSAPYFLCTHVSTMSILLTIALHSMKPVFHVPGADCQSTVSTRRNNKPISVKCANYWFVSCRPCSFAPRSQSGLCPWTLLGLRSLDHLCPPYLQTHGYMQLIAFRCFAVLRFFTAQCTLVHVRGLGIASRPSVCPSVCPSVTLVDCDHIGWKS